MRSSGWSRLRLVGTDAAGNWEGHQMIRVSRLNGGTLGLNADLIERIEQMPDTVVTLIDGKKLLVTESPDEIIEQVINFRATVIARVPFIDTSRTEIQPVLRVVSDREEL